MEGFLPANFAKYPMLRSLALSYNRFRGPIPWQYSKKGSSLRRLYLDGNYLNRSPPAGFFSGEGRLAEAWETIAWRVARVLRSFA
ncbi:UNVERIFIED_CONTAM: hypothetical protein Slati_3282100 [Sesamum latifolium]